MKKFLIITAALISFSGYAFASEGDDFVLKFRGLFNQVNGKLQSLPEQSSPAAKSKPQSIGKFASNGVGGEVALTMHVTERFAGELSSGLTLYRTKGSTTSSLASAYSVNSKAGKKKDLYAIPTYFTFQYHIAPFGAVRPYVGGGYHYTYMQSKTSDYKVNNSGGGVIQAGLDLVFQDDAYINLDVKQYFLKTKIRYNTGLIRDQKGGQISPTMKLDPISVGLGIGFKL